MVSSQDRLEITTKSDRETKKIGVLFARALKEAHQGKCALVVSLEGDLGSGKTTFTKGFAEGLGIRDTVQSPTFVILKTYPLRRRTSKLRRPTSLVQYLIHIDAYRITPKDLNVLGWQEFTKDPHNIVLVEWGERLKKSLPKNTIHIKFFHEKFSHTRRIQFGQ